MAENVLSQYIAKIEGHGQLCYSVGESLVQVKIDEGERLFEKLVLGQSYKDVAFITARICGVCPTAHTFAAIAAVENGFGVETTGAIRSLRKALLSAQIAQSHALHLFFLALPDYMGVKSGLELQSKDPRVFKTATTIKAVADKVIEVVGGRAIHPVTPTVGGFLTTPKEKEIESLITELRSAIRMALETLDLFAGFRYPHLARKTEYFSLSKDGAIDILGDTIISSEGVSSHFTNYPYIIKEKTKPYSTAKFAEHEGRGFMVGAIARVNMMQETDFNERTQKAIKSLGIKLPLLNGFKNNLAQAIELVHFLEEAEKSLTNFLWDKKERTKVGFRAKAGTGIGAIEAPRGTLYHSYEFDEKGIVRDCDIITPTVQNLTNLEDDANEYLRQNKSVSIPRRERELEMLIRAYDPCITCSVH